MPRPGSITVRFLLACALVTAVGGAALAGPLVPPNGPVASTYKTLTEVEPRVVINAANTPGDADSVFRITQPGSYYLTGNITGVAGKSGIEVAASGVTIDLNGFRMTGVAGSLDGIAGLAGGVVNVAVSNGSLELWGGDGVGLFTNTASITLRGLTVRNCGGRGLGVGVNSIVSECSVFNSADDGVFAGDGSVISLCNARACAGNGIRASAGCVVSNCTAVSNSGAAGFYLGNTCTITACTARSNDGAGVITGSACTVTGCMAESNTEDGISAWSGSTVIDCSSRSNTLDGIECASGCQVRGNTSSSNGGGASFGVGIRVTGSDNRIEGNNCTDADRGIYVGVAGNFIVRNTCSGNTINWDIMFGNAVAPIVNASLNGGFIQGDTYNGSLGSTDPNANFTY